MTISNSAGSKRSIPSGGWSRREFLKCGAAMAGAAMPLYSTLAANTAPKKVRIGVVGGGFGTSFQWHEHPDCIVEAVSDLRPERREGLMRTYKCEQVVQLAGRADAGQEHRCGGDLHGGAEPRQARGRGDEARQARHLRRARLPGRRRRGGATAARYRQEVRPDLHDGRDQLLPAADDLRPQVPRGGQVRRDLLLRGGVPAPGLESLYFENGKRTWRYGLAPMHYPTHCTAFLSASPASG